MTDIGRRGFMKRAVATAAAAAFGAVVLAPGAVAQDEPQDLMSYLNGRPLPRVGEDIPVRVSAANVPLKLNALGALTLDFKGGVNLKVKTSKTDGLVMEVQGFHVEADTSPSTPDSGTLIAMSVTRAAITPHSVLQAADGGGVEMLIHLSLTVEATDKATGETTSALSTDPTKYATLKATDVKEFPPVNQLCTLLEPVQLYDPQGNRAGTLEGFDAIMSKAD
ncbi:hypothetical protein ACHGLA_00540 [Streptomyces sp. YH02]|uniref:hypothetical protein n=1 Tax=Streptomyces sp. YH02 TaxID=3256999 RepID=UPI003756577D